VLYPLPPLEPIQECDPLVGLIRLGRERPMWTPEHPAAARRQDLPYASDLTDEEWALGGADNLPRHVVPGDRGTSICARYQTAFSTCRLPMTGAAQGFAATMRFTSQGATRPAANEARPRPSSAVKRQGAQTGGLDGPASAGKQVNLPAPRHHSTGSESGEGRRSGQSGSQRHPWSRNDFFVITVDPKSHAKHPSLR
jgi:hypothetical protein